ncbi:carboxymuconolactone decarboxylase family protein [Bradyrhizobium sp. 2TAF24]|uniref:carboxymuconolactone decarboxylase family protein n=1 Tax=Bradyrhizobium sp. 2TAF24 TaxID=3233011 RepID=UPI003F90D740
MRFKPIPPGEMNAAQRAVHDEAVAGKRGSAPAPLLAWLHSPDMARHAGRLGAFLRFDTSLGAQLSELAILVTARHWSAAYEWYAHKKLALQAGLAPDIIEAINRRHVPDLDDPKAQIVYEVSEALHESRVLPEALYARARALLGERGLVELIGLLGYYTLVSMTLNAYEVGLPEGEVSDLAP